MTVTTLPTDTPTEWKHLFGVCGCLGEDFGFDPLLLRAAFGVSIIFAPVMAAAVYVTLGVAVLSSRVFFPNRKPRVAG